MKTNELIDMLTTNVEPVKGRRVWVALTVALLISGAASFCLMMMTVGLRSSAPGGFHVGLLIFKLLFSVSLVIIGGAALNKLHRPGQEIRRLFKIVFVPFFIVGLAGAISLALKPSAVWDQMVMGTAWAACLFCIPLFAIIPFIGLVWVMRREAPTNLTRTGAIAGLVAGAVGAAIYAFHCPDDSLPFIAIWYGIMIALCAWIGAKLGPRFLRW